MRLTTIPPSWARAIREDAAAPSGGYTSRQRLRIERRVVAPHVVTIMVGEEPRRDYRHMALGDLTRYNRRSPRWLKRAPFCRACAKPIGHGEKAVTFTLYPNEEHGWNTTAYIHLECKGGDLNESEAAPGRGRPAGAAQGAAGIALREIRESRGLTLEDVATRAGMKKSYLAQLELGKFSPTVRTLERVALALGADLELILRSR